MVNEKAVKEHEGIISEALTVQVAELFSTLGDARRVRIIDTLSQGEMSVSELADRIDLSHSAASRYLPQMRLVRTRKEGRYVGRRACSALFQCGLEHVQHG